MARQPISLKGQALALLARREYSRADLRERLLQVARKQVQSSAAAARTTVSTPLGAEGPLNVFGEPITDEAVASSEPACPSDADLLVEVDQILDWLVSRQFQSDARFVEARVNGRAPRHGERRIRHELAQHGVDLDAETALHLRETELERAREVWKRRFGEVSTDPRERARQMRFLAARGFDAGVVRRVVGGRDDD